MTAIRDLKFVGALAALRRARPQARLLDIYAFEERPASLPAGAIGAQWRVLWRLDLADPYWGPLSPTEFVFLWNSDIDELDGLALRLYADLTAAAYLTPALQPAAIYFDEHARLFLQTPLYPQPRKSSALTTPKKLPRFLAPVSQ